jgi:hypothetical protein
MKHHNLIHKAKIMKAGKMQHHNLFHKQQKQDYFDHASKIKYLSLPSCHRGFFSHLFLIL